MKTIKTSIFQINLLTAAAYIASLLAFSRFGIELPVQTIGILYLFVITPLTLLCLAPIENFSLLEKFFSSLVLFFFLFVPAIFLFNQILAIPITDINLLFFNIGILFVTFAGAKLLKKQPQEILINTNIRTWGVLGILRKNIPLIIAIFSYISLHAIFFFFYKFIPEWDSYGNFVHINKAIESGMITHTYRGFFEALIVTLSIFTKISPYAIFTIIFIPLQTTLILTLNQFLTIYKIKGRFLSALILLSATAVPVINMEIDMTRPQNVFLFSLPILILFLYRQITNKDSYIFGALSGLILLFGLNYHEFFIFPFILYTIWIFAIYFLKFLKSRRESKQTIIFFQSIIILLLASILLDNSLNVFSGVIAVLQRIFERFIDFHSWRLWFIDNYNSDGANLQMGWPGITGAAKYYGYYFSPMGILLFVTFIMTTKKAHVKKDPLLKILSPLLFVFFAFAEILPRINYIYLPDRFWVLIDMLFLLSLPALLNNCIPQQNKRLRLSFTLSLIVAIAIGIGGSLFVAASKKALTSEREYQAALWIKANTPKDAFFITQSANGPMIQYFAQRNLTPSNPEYFLSQNILEEDIPGQINGLQLALDERNLRISAIVADFTANKMSFMIFADAIQNEKVAIQQLKTQIETRKQMSQESRYIVYSYDKFNGLYSQRDWWNLANARGANIEKFTKAFPLVYTDGVIFIWKIR